METPAKRGPCRNLSSNLSVNSKYLCLAGRQKVHCNTILGFLRAQKTDTSVGWLVAPVPGYIAMVHGIRYDRRRQPWPKRCNPSDDLRCFACGGLQWPAYDAAECGRLTLPSYTDFSAFAEAFAQRRRQAGMVTLRRFHTTSQ